MCVFVCVFVCVCVCRDREIESACKDSERGCV